MQNYFDSDTSNSRLKYWLVGVLFLVLVVSLFAWSRPDGSNQLANVGSSISTGINNDQDQVGTSTDQSLADLTESEPSFITADGAIEPTVQSIQNLPPVDPINFIPTIFASNMFDNPPEDATTTSATRRRSGGGGGGGSSSPAPTSDTSATTTGETATSTATSTDSTATSTATTTATSTPGTATSTATTTELITFSPELIQAGGIVSINLDDGWESAYNLAVPILKEAKYKATVYMVSQYFWENFMTEENLLELQELGFEVGAHTRTHPHLVGLTPEEIESEINGSREDLLNLGFEPVEVFAYTYGEMDDAIIQAVKDAGFIGSRGTQGGYNTKDTDRYKLKSVTATQETTVESVIQGIDEAVANNGWYILNLHRFNEPIDFYNSTPEFLQQIVDYLKENDIPVVTNSEGIEHFLDPAP